MYFKSYANTYIQSCLHRHMPLFADLGAEHAKPEHVQSDIPILLATMIGSAFARQGERNA